MPIADQSCSIGVLPGEGIGSEVIDGTLTVLRAVESAGRTTFDIRFGGPIGLAAVASCGQALSQEVVEFCEGVFAENGAILAGPGGGRFVYDMRRHFDLYCKFSPITIRHELRHASRLKAECGANVDILLVRDNIGGVYQGEWSENSDPSHGRTASHTFSYNHAQVSRIVRVAATIAKKRRGELTLVVKPSGVPTISELWSECAREAARDLDVSIKELEIDNAAYQLVQNPQQFDVIVSPNLFGDILSDVAGVLLGSRGLCYGASFSSDGAAVYQTNHGAAYDMATMNRANPVGQIFSLAMMLRESFELIEAADLIEAAVVAVWQRGCRTEDLPEK
ncbi:MAG: isocitrate/isopropylmalate family dehydrogenase, partial [Planctomycetaceae bacterium]